MTETTTNLPRHIAIIMDGNGRWAKQRSLPRIAGHRAGIKTLRKLIEYAAQKKLQAITVYAFSKENWQRPQQEVSMLMDLFMSSLQSEVADLHKNNVCLRLIGERDVFTEKLKQAIEHAENLTANNDGLQLNVAINYSGRWDILQACQSLLNTDAGDEDFSEEMLSRHLCLSALPEPDLFIRTGGEKRISNFLLWQLAYTELYFSDALWPDFDSVQFEEAINWFANRERRFGKISEQINNKQSL